jgi:hypothetical protein
MKNIIFILTVMFLLPSCIYTNVARVGRHKRLITIEASVDRSANTLHYYLIRKSRPLGCDYMYVVEIKEGSHAQGMCITAP